MAWGRLALIQVAGESDQVLAEMATCFGYQALRRHPEEKRLPSEAGRGLLQAHTDSPVTDFKMPDARFLRVRQAMRKQSEPQDKSFLNDPAWQFTEADRKRGGTYCFAKPEPLLPMSRLLPFLLNGLGQQQAGVRLDHRQLTRRLSNGRVVKKLPFLLRQRWSRRLLILVDANKRLEPYWSDFENIVQKLQQHLGSEAVRAVRLDEDSRDRPLRVVSWPEQDRAWEEWRVPAANVPILILGDLGVGDTSGRSRALWFRVSRDLRTLEAPVVTLNPLGYSAVGARISRQLQPNPLNDLNSLPRYPLRNGFDIRDQCVAEQKLLALLSVLPVVDTGLLRRLRLELGWGASDIEGWLWNHPDIQQTALGIRVRSSMAKQYQDYYQQSLKGTDTASIFWRIVNDHHREAFQGLKRLEQASHSIVEGETNEEVRQYLQRLVASISQGGTGSSQHEAFIQQAKTVLNVLPEQVWKSELADLASAVYAFVNKDAMQRDAWADDLPEGFEPEKAAQWLLDSSEQEKTRHWQVSQVGSEGGFTVQPATDETSVLSTSALADIEALADTPPRLSGLKRRNQMVRADRHYRVADEPVVLETSRQRLELDAINLPEWANRIWCNQDGLFTESQSNDGQTHQWQWYPGEQDAQGEITKRGVWYPPTEKRKPRIYLSYGSDNNSQRLLEAFISDLWVDGFEFFYDKMLLSPGDSIDTFSSLEACDVLVVLLTRRSIRSSYMREEFEQAKKMGKRVYPIPLEDVSYEYMSDDIWPALQNIYLPETGEAIEVLKQYLRENYANLAQLRKPAPEWAKNIVYDQYGLYADLTLKNITQRFRWIEPGTFMMGSPEDEEGRYDDEGLHQVTLTKGFWLADTTVTQELWEAVMDGNPSHFKGRDRPVEQVSWKDCQQFIQKLNAHIPGLQAKLPTEAEWEYACRAGTQTPFFFGGKDDLNTDRVNYSGQWDEINSDGETKPVKSYPPNGWGLYEMHGNVWERCQDAWQKNLGTKPVTDPQGQAGGEQGKGAERVVRGGAWLDWGWHCRSAYRGGYAPGRRLNGLGLRLSLGHELRPGAGSAESGAGEHPHPNPSP